MPKKSLKNTSSAIPTLILIEILVGAVLSVGSLFFFFNVAKAVFENDFTSIDTTATQLIQSIRSPFMTDLMIGISVFGNEALLFFACCLFLLLLYKRYKEEVFLLMCMVGLGIILNLFLKELTRRPRPEITALFDLTTYSFPSGHSMNSFVFYATVSYFFYHFTKDKKKTFLISLGTAFLILSIGVSRIYLGVHYPSDVLAGFIAGFWWFITILLVHKTIPLLPQIRKRQAHR